MPRISATIASMQPMFEQAWPSSAAVFLPHGNVPAPGSLFARPALADTYDRVCREAVGSTREARIDAARRAWYRGFVAEAVGRFFRDTDVLDTSGRRHRGLLTEDDFSRWSATIEDPVGYDYHGHTVLKCGPWSQGPVFLQQLALLQATDIGALDPVGVRFVHHVTEAAKLAYADREAYYGDPNFVTVPLETLLSDDYNASATETDRRDGIVATASRHGPRLRTDHRSRRRHLARALGRQSFAAGQRRSRKRRANHRSSRGQRGRHLPSRRDRSFRQHGQRHSLGRLAAVLAGDPRTWLPDGDQGSDVLATRWLAEQPAAEKAPAHHAVAQLRPARRQALDGVRHAGRRAAGSVVAHLLPAHGASRDGHPAGDRRTVVSLGALAVELLAAHRAPRKTGAGRPVSTTPSSPTLLALGHDASKGEDWSEGRLSGARKEADGQLYAGANPRGMQGYAVGR